VTCTVAVAVVGRGPIGAATAHRLALAGVRDVALVGPVLEDAGEPAYRSSGGSVCWHRSDRAKAAMIRRTAEFVRARAAAGAPVRVRETPYLFLDSGVLAPALNVAAPELVADLVGLATGAGVAEVDVGPVTAVEPVAGGHRAVGSAGTVDARVVVLALGAANPVVVPQLPARLEKRQLFVLDLPVDEQRAALPHVVAPIGAGYAYVFVKDTPDGLRVLVGQENLVADDDLTGPVDSYGELLAAGVADRFPFLRGAAVERIMWGVDWADKLPRVVEHRPGLLTVNCGSAVRACVAIGEQVAAAVQRTLAG
jgi:glycine/D-amino acid oxidase-like deaminating enzyme